MRSFSPYRRVKMEPEACGVMAAGSTIGRWEWGPATKPPVPVGWPPSLQTEDAIGAHAPFSTSGAVSSLHSAAGGSSSRGVSPHAAGPLDRRDGFAGIANPRHPAAGFRGFFPPAAAVAASAASMPAAAHARFHPPHPIPSRDGVNHSAHRLVLYPPSDNSDGSGRDPDLTVSDARKGSSNPDDVSSAQASRAASLSAVNDVMCGLTSSQPCGQPPPPATHCLRESPTSAAALQHLSIAHPHPAMVVGAFSGVGAGLGLDCGVVGAGDNGGGSDSNSGSAVVNGYDSGRGAFLIPSDPRHWSALHVQRWLDLVSREHGLRALDPSRLRHVDGRGLCRMSREELQQLGVGAYEADVLVASLTYMRRACVSPMSPESTPAPNSRHWACAPSAHDPLVTRQDMEFSKYSWLANTPSGARSLGYGQAAFGTACQGKAYSNPPSPTWRMRDPYKLFSQLTSRLCTTGSGQIQLWQFLLELLSDNRNAGCIAWEGTNGEFKLVDPDEVARRWGERKSKPNMNYDKLSRALRYYYDKNIMTKVHGKRYAYRFDFAGLAQAIQPAAAPDASPPYRPPDWMLGGASTYPGPPKPHLPPYAASASQMNPALLGASHPYWTGHQHPGHHHHHHHHPGSMYPGLQAPGIGGPSAPLAPHLSSCYA